MTNLGRAFDGLTVHYLGHLGNRSERFSRSGTHIAAYFTTRANRDVASPLAYNDVMTIQSRHSYSDTIGFLSKAIVEAGNTVFAIIDQSAAAADAGLTLRPTSLIVFGNPKGGTPLMDAFPLMALELPLKLLVWEEGGIVSVAFVPMSEIAARYGVVGMEERVAAMDGALHGLTSAVA